MEQHVLDMFAMFDRNGDGKIDVLELSHVLSALDSQWTQPRLNRLFELVDVNGDGNIEYSEFVSWAFAQPSVRSYDVSQFRKAVGTASRVPNVRQKLQKADVAIESQRTATGDDAAPAVNSRSMHPRQGGGSQSQPLSRAQASCGAATVSSQAGAAGAVSPTASRSPVAREARIARSQTEPVAAARLSRVAAGSPGSVRANDFRVLKELKQAMLLQAQERDGRPVAVGGSDLLVRLLGPTLYSKTDAGTSKMSTSEFLAEKTGVIVLLADQNNYCDATTWLRGQYHNTKGDFEVVFAYVPADSDTRQNSQEHFRATYRHMPWAAVPPTSDISWRLVAEFDVGTMPYVIVFDNRAGAEDPVPAHADFRRIQGLRLVECLQTWGFDESCKRSTQAESSNDRPSRFMRNHMAIYDWGARDFQFH